MSNILTSNEFTLHTRIGNKLFNLAFLLGCVKKYDRQLILPDYFLFKYLKNKIEINNEIKGENTFHFRHDGFDPVYVDEFFEQNKNNSINLALNPYCQSERWWEHCRDYVLEMLEFKKEEVDKVKEQYKDFFDKSTIGISIRLGTDFTGDKGFFQISHNWYIDVLNTQFPNWREEYNVIIFSDNIAEAQSIFKKYPFKYAEQNKTYILQYDSEHYHSEKAMNHLILGSLMDNFISSNSTFSWWCSYLSKNRRDNKEGKVICSGRNFDNHYLEKSKNIDYYPKDWIIHPV